MGPETEYRQILCSFADAYLAQRYALEEGNTDEKSMTRAVTRYMEEAGKVLDFISGTFGQEEPELPDMDVYFQDGAYNDFARRIYNGILKSGQFPKDILWKLKTRIILGDLLYEKLNRERENLKEEKII